MGILYASFGGWVVTDIINLINTIFMEWPKEYLLLDYIPYAITGGGISWSMATTAFVADISSPETRGFRLFVFGFVWKIGSPVGTILGSILFKRGGFLCVHTTVLVTKCLGFFVMVWKLEKFYKVQKEKYPENEIEGVKAIRNPNPVSLSHIS